MCNFKCKTLCDTNAYTTTHTDAYKYTKKTHNYNTFRMIKRLIKHMTNQIWVT